MDVLSDGKYMYLLSDKYIRVYLCVSIYWLVSIFVIMAVSPTHVHPKGLRTVLLAALCWFLKGYNRTWNGNVNPIHVLLMPVPDNDPISSRCRTAVISSAAPTGSSLHATFSYFNFPIPVRSTFLDNRKKISDGPIYTRKMRRDGNGTLKRGQFTKV